MNLLSFIETRRDGRDHPREDLFEFARRLGRGEVPDYQAAAWLMAAYLRPLSHREAAWLTEAMADSGERLDLEGLPEPWVDKHSTGGVGDKTTLVVVPMLGACGLTVMKMSGRGLGITGGTIDKLESIPGFETDLSPESLKRQAQNIGIALGGQTANLAPADKALYALRDVTGTTASMPLIASSILCKKIAGGAKYVTLDVKCGRGTFMPNLAQAQELAQLLIQIGNASGLHTSAIISDMDAPLGCAIGNALEVREAWQVLQGEPLSPTVMRFRMLCVELVAHVLQNLGTAESEARLRAEESLTSGRAWELAQRWLTAQGATSLDLVRAPATHEVNSVSAGVVHEINPVILAETVIELGGGRKRKEDAIDHRVGIECLVHVGQPVGAGEPIARIHTTESSPDFRPSVAKAVRIEPTPKQPVAVVIQSLRT